MSISNLKPLYTWVGLRSKDLRTHWGKNREVSTIKDAGLDGTGTDKEGATAGSDNVLDLPYG